MPKEKREDVLARLKASISVFACEHFATITGACPVAEPGSVLVFQVMRVTIRRADQAENVKGRVWR